VNKSLLIIICDFLLISVLALVEFKPDIEVAGVDPQALRQQAAEEMLELLQLSLDHENAQRREVEDSLGQTREQLEQTQSALQETSTSLEQVSTTLDRTEAEKAALADSLDSTRVSLQLTLEEKSRLAQSLQQNEARQRQLQEELQAQQQLAAEKGSALADAQDNLARLESQQQQMSTELRILDTEKQMLQQNLVAARAEVERARIEAERAQQRSESLAAGVSELAASSTALQEEIRQAQTLSLNAIYKQFVDNRVFIRFDWRDRTRGAMLARQSTLQSLILDTGSGYYAVFATANTPLGDRDARSVSARLQVGGRAFTITEVGFMQAEPGIAAVQVPAEVVTASGLAAFSVTTEPLRFATAVLVSDDREVYGEIPIRVPAGEPGYLEVQSRLFNRLFGEFSPTAGDYVFSLSGELTGIMVRGDRARIVDVPVFGDFRKLE
jgi:hypothetical protein